MMRILIFLSSIVSTAAFAYTVETKPSTQIYLSIPTDGGATVQFPEPIKAISGGRSFRISTLGAELDSKTQKEMNPQIFNVVPNAPNVDELITFVFPNKEGEARTLGIRFRAKEQATNFYQIKFPKPSRAGSLKGFLSAETTMLVSMLRDEDGFGKQVLNTKVKIDGASELDVNVIRRFESLGLTGFVLDVRNTTRDMLSINLNALSLGVPNRAVMSNAERDNLSSCSKNKETCSTKIFILSRGENDAVGLGARLGFPFIKSTKEE